MVVQKIHFGNNLLLIAVAQKEVRENKLFGDGSLFPRHKLMLIITEIRDIVYKSLETVVQGSVSGLCFPVLLHSHTVDVRGYKNTLASTL